MLAQSKVKSEGFFFFFLWEETLDIYFNQCLQGESQELWRCATALFGGRQ